MLEIFIPTQIKNNKLEINRISANFLDAVKTLHWKVQNFESTFFSGIKINTEIFNENIIILCNGEFWKKYFLDYDIDSPSLEERIVGRGILWVKIIWNNEIWNDIQKIMLNIAEITGILSSENLLTHSKKQEIVEKIQITFFSLSWVVFLLYELKEKAQENYDELSTYSWNIEYEWQAQLLKETSLTKNIELQASIDKLEGKIEMFIWVIWKIL